MAFITKFGKVLLNPSEKGKRFSRQLKNNCVEETGKVLSAEERKYREGYLSARRDSADAWTSKHQPEKHEKKMKKRYLDKKARRREKKHIDYLFSLSDID